MDEEIKRLGTRTLAALDELGNPPVPSKLAAKLLRPEALIAERAQQQKGRFWTIGVPTFALACLLFVMMPTHLERNITQLSTEDLEDLSAAVDGTEFVDSLNLDQDTEDDIL